VSFCGDFPHTTQRTATPLLLLIVTPDISGKTSNKTTPVSFIYGPEKKKHRIYLVISIAKLVLIKSGANLHRLQILESMEESKLQQDSLCNSNCGARSARRSFNLASGTGKVEPNPLISLMLCPIRWFRQ
jgi:hypothetical protein